MKKKKFVIIMSILILLVLILFVRFFITVTGFTGLELKKVKIINNCDYNDKKNINKIGTIKTANGKRNVYSVCLNILNLSKVKNKNNYISFNKFVSGSKKSWDMGLGQVRLYEGKNYNIFDCHYDIMDKENNCSSENSCGPVVIVSSNEKDVSLSNFCFLD